MLGHLTSAGCLVAVPVSTKLLLGAELGWLCTFWPQAGKARPGLGGQRSVLPRAEVGLGFCLHLHSPSTLPPLRETRALPGRLLLWRPPVTRGQGGAGGGFEAGL